jgi:hypothetical protein
MQLILFEQLFRESNRDEKWESNSPLQLKYVQLLVENNLLSTNEQKLASKNARVKSAPIEQFGLIERKNKLITPKGLQLLKLINDKSYKKRNNFLQIDLIALFFLQNLFFYSKKDKNENIFEIYLEIFKQMGGYLSLEEFKLVPLVKNLEFELFMSELKKIRTKKSTPTKLISLIIQNDHELNSKKEEFIQEYNNSNLEGNYFYTSKGVAGQTTVFKIMEIFETIASCKKLNKNEKNSIKELFIKSSFKVYTGYILPTQQMHITKKNFIQNYKSLFRFVRTTIKNNFATNFFNFIHSCRIKKNLDDYLDLNKRHLLLSDLFEFSSSKVSLSKIFYIILEHPNNMYKKLQEIEIKEDSLDFLLKDSYVLKKLKEYNVSSVEELKRFKYENDKKILKQTIEEKFSKQKITKEILPLFIDRTSQNDNKLQSLVTNSAKIPTIFEYIIALCWYYLDEKNLDIILNAGLSLDSQMLPKSHAVGGNADIYIEYKDHILMLEVTLTQKSNQRRAEMEPVSRHLGNLLLGITNSVKKENSYAIFIAPHLDTNVINDFRAKRSTYWERDNNFIKGMNILPFSVKDIIKLINSQKSYKELKLLFYSLLNSKTSWGSKWYKEEILKSLEKI